MFWDFTVGLLYTGQSLDVQDSFRLEHRNRYLVVKYWLSPIAAPAEAIDFYYYYELNVFHNPLLMKTWS